MSRLFTRHPSDPPLIDCFRGQPRPRPPRALRPDETPPWHHHQEGELIWSLDEPIEQRTSDGLFVSPPRGATYVPPLTMHVGRYSQNYIAFLFDPLLCTRLPAKSCVVAITPKLRAVIMATLEASSRRRSLEPFIPVLWEEIRDSGLQPLENPFPVGAEISTLVQKAHAGEDLPETLSDWSRLSNRDLEQLKAELKHVTGKGYREWRRLVRTLRGLREIARGKGVTQAGRCAGFENPTHFINAFKECLGTTPRTYYAPLFKPGNETTQPAHPLVAPRGVRNQRSSETPQQTAPSNLGTLEPLPVIRAFTVRHILGRYNEPHDHVYGEFMWPEGTMSLGTARGTYVGHAELALWVPTEAVHESQIWGPLHVFLVRRDKAELLPEKPCAVPVTPALRSILRELLDLGSKGALGNRVAEAIAIRFLNSVTEAQLAPLPIPMFEPRKLRPMVDALRANPSIERTHEEWAEEMGMSRSTLFRACKAELGCSFGSLITLMQIRRAVELLALGETVQEAAHEVGYQSVSKFIAMFRRIVGVTPAKYARMSGELRIRHDGLRISR